MTKAFLKVETSLGGLALIAVDAIVAIKDWAVEGNLCCQITYMVGDIPIFVEAQTTAAVVWDQMCHPRAGAACVEDQR
jgi:hypothetical protein